jgi:hypothetical protein
MPLLYLIRANVSSTFNIYILLSDVDFCDRYQTQRIQPTKHLKETSVYNLW